MKKATIVGAAGYTGGELIRILFHHPKVEFKQLLSQSQAGKKVSLIHQDLIGELDTSFTNTFDQDTDILFLCMGHGRSKIWLAEQEVKASTLVIDLSSDFRMNSSYVYGLAEWKKSALPTVQHIANPGCYATAIQLGLLPLITARAIQSDVHVQAITGSTGAGQTKTDSSHFSWRNQNISSYKAFEHQHLEEIYQGIHSLDSSFNKEVVFIPIRGNFSKGIFATLCFKSKLTEEEIYALFQTTYHKDKFIHISKEEPNLKQVLNTNKCVLHIKKRGNYVMVISIIDNLIKGASGQAVQNMNLHFEWPEETGLKLKALVF